MSVRGETICNNPKMMLNHRNYNQQKFTAPAMESYCVKSMNELFICIQSSE